MACACAATPLAAFAESRDSRDVRAPLDQFPYSAVKLHPSRLLEQFDQQQQLFMRLDESALLKPFRQRAGQPAPGADMGGWYDDSRDFHIDPKDWSTANWHGFIPGHSFGQYVSGLSRGYASSRDERIRRRVAALIEQYGATISPRFFDGYTLPAYTFDKLAVGLLDAFQYANVAVARDLLERVADAAIRALPDRALTREERRQLPHTGEAQIWDEPYTLPENLFLASQAGMGARYRSMAMRYLQDDALFNPLAAGTSPLKGKHAYSHVNALCSAVQAYLASGDRKYLAAARNGFDFVDAQSYATGGWGPNEELLASDDSHTQFDMLESTHRS
ncbi:MAG TPA: beta-L-arabinofuranosidase domain-containing protein, partial [Steroidobacteraceae bacterium]|nr:beta-L-arabinofuranosidase domain-containing protein [Steroidobacteraceae bacterium]